MYQRADAKTLEHPKFVIVKIHLPYIFVFTNASLLGILNLAS
jgi:hypothetical protein